MNQYLVDHTREYLIAGAEFAAQREEGDLRIQILAQRDGVMVRACAGGIHKTWLQDTCDWDVLATDRENPLPDMISNILFRLDRLCETVAGKRESGQKDGNGGEQDTART